MRNENLMDIKNAYLRMLDIVYVSEQAAEGVVEDVDNEIYNQLNDSKEDLEDKLEACASVVETLEAGIQSAKKREDSWKAHRKHMESNCIRLRAWVKLNVSNLPGKTIETPNFRIGLAKKAPSVDVFDDASFGLWALSNLDDECVKHKTEVSPKKAPIANRLKNGDNIPGCKLVTGQTRLVIK